MSRLAGGQRPERLLGAAQLPRRRERGIEALRSGTKSCDIQGVGAGIDTLASSAVVAIRAQVRACAGRSAEETSSRQKLQGRRSRKRVAPPVEHCSLRKK